MLRVHATLFALTATSALATSSCTPQGDPTITTRFTDDFARVEVGPAYNVTGPGYRIVDGKLYVRGARNHPLWLERRLPRDVRIEFDARSDSPDGDIKVELFGDGVSFATEAAYTATGYVVIFGGWRNSLDVIARMDEHGRDRVERRSRGVVQGRTYHFVIERRGGTLRATVDGELLGEMVDPEPLYGRGHDHFAFNDWDAPITFDNLVIKAL